MPDLSPLRQAVSALRPLFKTQGHDPHPNWGDGGHDPVPQLGVWFTYAGVKLGGQIRLPLRI